MSNQVSKLTSQQQKAIRLFLSGRNDTQVAEELGVARQTVNNWKNRRRVFVMELERQQKELRRESQRQLWGLVADSIGVLRQSLASDNERIRQSTAVHVLKAIGLYGLGPDEQWSELSALQPEPNEIQILIEQFRQMGSNVVSGSSGNGH